MFRNCDAGGRRAGDFFLRRAEGEGGRGVKRETLRGSRPGGKAEARGCAFESGRDRTLHSDARGLRDALRHQAGRRRRVATHGRAARAAAARENVRLRLRRPPPRYGRQTRLPPSYGGVCAETRRSGWGVSEIPENFEAVNVWRWGLAPFC